MENLFNFYKNDNEPDVFNRNPPTFAALLHISDKEIVIDEKIPASLTALIQYRP